MRNVMTRAWEIAKEAEVKFGGKVKEYFALSLRQAWSEVKKGVDKMEKYRAEYERRQAIGLGDQTFEEYYAIAKEVEERNAKLEKESEQYMDKAREVFAHLDPKEFMVVTAAKAAFSKALATDPKNRAYRTALDRALREFKSEMPASEKVKPGLTGPIYDNDSKPTYF